MSDSYKHREFNKFYYIQLSDEPDRYFKFTLASYESGWYSDDEYKAAKFNYKHNRVISEEAIVRYETDSRTYITGLVIAVTLEVDGERQMLPVDVLQNNLSFTYGKDSYELTDGEFDLEAGMKIINKHLFNPNPKWLEEDEEAKYRKFNDFLALEPIKSCNDCPMYQIAYYHQDDLTDEEFELVKYVYRNYRVKPEQVYTDYQTDNEYAVYGEIQGIYRMSRLELLSENHRISWAYNTELTEEDFDLIEGISIVNEHLYNPNPEWLEEEL